MAVPFFAVIPWLAGVLVEAFAGLAGMLAAYFSRRVAVIGAFTTVFVGGWVALQALMLATWSGLQWVSPPFMTEEVFPVVLTLLPDLWLPAVNAIIVARIAAWLWEVQRAWLIVVAG